MSRLLPKVYRVQLLRRPCPRLLAADPLESRFQAPAKGRQPILGEERWRWRLGEEPISQYVVRIGQPASTNTEELLTPGKVAEQWSSAALHAQIKVLCELRSRQQMVIHLSKGQFSIGAIQQLPPHIWGYLCRPQQLGIEIAHIPLHDLSDSMGDPHILVIWRSIDRNCKLHASRAGGTRHESRVKATRQIGDHGASRCGVACRAIDDHSRSSIRRLAYAPVAGFWLVPVPVLSA